MPITESIFNNKATGSFETDDLHTDTGEICQKAARDIEQAIPIEALPDGATRKARVTWVLEYTDVIEP